MSFAGLSCILRQRAKLANVDRVLSTPLTPSLALSPDAASLLLTAYSLAYNDLLNVDGVRPHQAIVQDSTLLNVLLVFGELQLRQKRAKLLPNIQRDLSFVSDFVTPEHEVKLISSCFH